MYQMTMTIDVAPARTEASFPVYNPATGEPFADAPECTPVQVDEAMTAARDAFPAWSADDSSRRSALRRAAAVLREHRDELGAIFTREQGRPLHIAREEPVWAADDIDRFAEVELPVEILEDDANFRSELHHRPYGVVAAIVPWNYPILIACWKIVQSLVTGNTVVLKPSPYTPLATLRMGELWRDVFPPGVLNIVSGGAGVGALMTQHPIPRKITFTGSVATGKKVAQAAAPDLKAVTLELGGNDPAIVLADVDPAKVADGLFWNAFFNTGQTCVAIKRIYAHETIYPQLVEELALRARSVKMGDGLNAESQLGPINNRMQFERVSELVEDARRHGAHFAAGGSRREGAGYFHEPTIVSEVSDGVRLVDEEQFGPALPVLSFQTTDDAVTRANATHFGLGGSVWTNDLALGHRIASQLECGTSWVNHHVGVNVTVLPQSGAKWSGVGYEFGKLGLAAYTRLHVVRVAKH